jgi:hypothetical protein
VDNYFGRLGACSFAATAFGAAKHAKDVPPRDLLDVVVRITPAEQLRHQIWIRRHVFEADDDAGDAVEVAAEPDVIDAGHFLDVIDVIRDLKQRCPRRGIRRAPLLDGLVHRVRRAA